MQNGFAAIAMGLRKGLFTPEGLQGFPSKPSWLGGDDEEGQAQQKAGASGAQPAAPVQPTQAPPPLPTPATPSPTWVQGTSAVQQPAQVDPDAPNITEAGKAKVAGAVDQANKYEQAYNDMSAVAPEPVAIPKRAQRIEKQPLLDKYDIENPNEKFEQIRQAGYSDPVEAGRYRQIMSTPHPTGDKWTWGEKFKEGLKSAIVNGAAAYSRTGDLRDAAGGALGGFGGAMVDPMRSSDRRFEIMEEPKILAQEQRQQANQKAQSGIYKDVWEARNKQSEVQRRQDETELGRQSNDLKAEEIARKKETDEANIKNDIARIQQGADNHKLEVEKFEEAKRQHQMASFKQVTVNEDGKAMVYLYDEKNPSNRIKLGEDGDAATRMRIEEFRQAQENDRNSTNEAGRMKRWDGDEANTKNPSNTKMRDALDTLKEATNKAKGNPNDVYYQNAVRNAQAAGIPLKKRPDGMYEPDNSGQGGTKGGQDLNAILGNIFKKQ